jgi:hypothetical protein
MNPQDMAAKCAEAVNFNASHGFDVETAQLLVVTPKGWKAPPKFPRGQIAQWKEDGSRLRYFPAFRVLAWLAANDLAKVELKSLPEGMNPK